MKLANVSAHTTGAGAGVPALVRDLGADVSRQRLTLLGGDVVDIVGEAPGDAPAPHLAFDHDRGWLRRWHCWMQRRHRWRLRPQPQQQAPSWAATSA